MEHRNTKEKDSKISLDLNSIIDYKRVKVAMYNNTNSEIPIDLMQIREGDSFLLKDRPYKCAMERWDVGLCKLPVYQVNREEVLQLGLYDTTIDQWVTGNVTDVDVQGGDSNGFIYNLLQVSEAINTAIIQNATGSGLSQLPEMSFDGKLFSLNWGGGVPQSGIELRFNANLYRKFHTFLQWDNGNGWHTIMFDESGGSTQYTDTLTNLSPVDQILLISDDLPIEPELSGSASLIDKFQTSRGFKKVISSYKVYPIDGSCYQSFSYVATANPVWMKLYNTNMLNTLHFSMYWQSVQGNQYKLTLSPWSLCEVKPLFKEITEIGF